MRGSQPLRCPPAESVKRILFVGQQGAVPEQVRGQVGMEVAVGLAPGVLGEHLLHFLAGSPQEPPPTRPCPVP